jgi:hypothetical protein
MASKSVLLMSFEQAMEVMEERINQEFEKNDCPKHGDGWHYCSICGSYGGGLWTVKHRCTCGDVMENGDIYSYRWRGMTVERDKMADLL